MSPCEAPRLRPKGRNGSCVRRNHAQQRGLTLIETIVTVAVMVVGVVGIASSLSAVERIATISQNQSQLEVSMRQLSDWVRNSSSGTCSSGAGCPAMPYRYCASTATYNGFVSNAEAAGGPLSSSSIGPNPIQSVAVSTSGTRTSGATNISVPALTSCSTGGDWGVQEITLKITANGNTVQRVVWKSMW